MIPCEKHGTCGFVESCKHVRQLLVQGRADEISVIRAYVFRMRVCAQCIEKHQLEKYVLEKPEQRKEEMSEPDVFWRAFEAAYDDMDNRIAWCIHCYDELHDKYGI